MIIKTLGTILTIALFSATPQANAGPDLLSIQSLDKLPVAAALPMVGYDRVGEFGPPWTDNNDDEFGHNGCSTRDDILARDLHSVFRQGCTVEYGVLDDPYTGKVINFARGPHSSLVQIDHLVALGDAWITGAQQLTQQERINLANDPRNLLAVDGHANNIKRDHDASGWLPPNEHFRCTYVSDQITVKTLYHLWVTPAEHDAMRAVLEDC